MRKQDKGSGRMYEQGRSTRGWIKGEKITDIAKLKVGTILIAVSHQFEAENLITIIPTPNELPQRPIRYWRYVQPDGQPTGESDAALWAWELTGASHEYFIASKQLMSRRKKRRPPIDPFLNHVRVFRIQHPVQYPKQLGQD